MRKLDHALALAAEGFHVFPCIQNGKRPAVPFKDWATRDPAKIAERWTAEPDSNIGVYAGRFADNEALLVVDVDVKKGKNGNDALLALELEGYELAHTRTATTASGGRHLYYRVPEAVKQGANVLGVGLDIRSRGGYVLGPGSVIGDAVYVFDSTAPIALAPAWLLERCGRSVRERSEPQSAPPAGVDREHSYDLALQYLRSHAPLAVEGAGGDETTYKVACRVRDFGVPIADAVELMAEHWNDNCTPPWAHDELAEKVANAYRYGENPPGAALPQADFTPVKPPRKAAFELFHEIKPDLLKPALVAGWLDCDAFSAMYGPPGSAKSFNAINLGFHVARGEPWFGCKTHRGGVLYLALEGGTGVRRRIEALRRHHNLGDTVLPFAVARGPVDLSEGGKSMQELHDLIVEAQAEMGCPVVLLIVDTFARANPAGDENSSRDMGVVIGKIDKLRAAFGCHVLAIHHSGKDVDKGLRGSMRCSARSTRQFWCATTSYLCPRARRASSATAARAPPSGSSWST